MNTVHGTMGGLPIDQAVRRIQQSCLAVQASLARIPAPARESRFSPVIASADNEDFAQRLRKAAERTRKQHAEQAEKERNRYRPLKRRPHTKSD